MLKKIYGCKNKEVKRKTWHRWEDNIKIDFKGMKCECGLESSGLA